MNDIEVRPMTVDRLVEFTDEALSARMVTIDAHLREYDAHVAALQEDLDKSVALVKFLHVERNAADLARRLQREEVVRVKCPNCLGSGMKPTDTTGGQIHTKSAFETVGKKKDNKPTEIAPADRCTGCDGKKWVLMERYKG